MRVGIQGIALVPLGLALGLAGAGTGVAQMTGCAPAARPSPPRVSELRASPPVAPASPALSGSPAGAADLAPPASAPLARAPEPPGTVDPPPPAPVIVVEPPYKLGARPGVSDAAQEAERARWNQGDRGTAAREIPPAGGHPLPRVIVSITKVKGPHAAREVERIARRTLWSKVVGCYRLGAYKDQTLSGKTTVRVQVSRAGRVTKASAAGSTLPDREVVACLAREVKSLALPKAKGGSSVTATIEVYPGDDPVPPPESAIKPGDGELAPEAIMSVMVSALPRMEACYRAVLPSLPELWGRITIRFHVTAAGKVDEAFEVESRFPEESVVRCVLREARALTFSPPVGGDVRFVVPLRLSPPKT